MTLLPHNDVAYLLATAMLFAVVWLKDIVPAMRSIRDSDISVTQPHCPRWRRSSAFSRAHRPDFGYRVSPWPAHTLLTSTASMR